MGRALNSLVLPRCNLQNASPRRIPEHMLYCSGILLFDLHIDWTEEHGTLDSLCTV